MHGEPPAQVLEEWDLPIDLENRPPVVGCFLVNYTLQVFDERGPSIRGWDQVAAQDVLDELRLDPISRGLRRAVDDARQLISLHAGGELDAAPGEAALADARDWVDCLASLESASTKHGDDVRGVVARAAALARDAGEPAALERILACLRPDFDAGVCRLEALSLVEDETGDDYLGAASRVPRGRPRSRRAPPAPAVFDGAESDGDDDGARASLRDILADPRTKLSPGPLSLDLATARRGAHGRRPHRLPRRLLRRRRRLRLRRARVRRPPRAARDAGGPEDVGPRHPRAVGQAAELLPPAQAAPEAAARRTGEEGPGAVAAAPARRRGRAARADPGQDDGVLRGLHLLRQLLVDARRRRREPGRPPAAEARPAPRGAAAPDRRRRRADDDDDDETPLSEYWLAPGGGGDAAGRAAMLNVWDDGYFTDSPAADGAFADDAAGDDDEPRDGGAGHRRRRQCARRDASLRVSQLLEGLSQNRLDPHALVTCEDYEAAPPAAAAPADDDDADDAQPFGLAVHPDVAFLCDVHAHLADAEIIGLLGGRWDPEKRMMHVQAPFPCRAVARDDDGATDVEMDPVSELVVRDVIKTHAMDVVGWYHSHPRFVAEPSVTDIENQRSYQSLFHDEALGLAPFIGLIVGTYDTNAPGPNSVFRYFHVAPPGGVGPPDDAGAPARETRRSAAAASGDAPQPMIPRALKATVRSYKRGLRDAARAARREGRPPPPEPAPGASQVPFGFLLNGHPLGCACCAPAPAPKAAAPPEEPADAADARRRRRQRLARRRRPSRPSRRPSRPSRRPSLPSRPSRRPRASSRPRARAAAPPRAVALARRPPVALAAPVPIAPAPVPIAPAAPRRAPRPRRPGRGARAPAAPPPRRRRGGATTPCRRPGPPTGLPPPYAQPMNFGGMQGFMYSAPPPQPANGAAAPRRARRVEARAAAPPPAPAAPRARAGGARGDGRAQGVRARGARADHRRRRAAALAAAALAT
ncbi:RNA polymerase II transcription regulator recruiting protein [Aureococcus anophagefferens]|nr:RNA polymerase II transcription regulator recruiting protein [Aureococcus anophagefferens]